MSVYTGEFVVMVGPSKGGESTLPGQINMLETFSGRVRLWSAAAPSQRRITSTGFGPKLDAVPAVQPLRASLGFGVHHAGPARGARLPCLRLIFGANSTAQRTGSGNQIGPGWTR